MAMENLDPGEVDAMIHELETKMSRLRAIYEQYFMGIERMPPRTLRKDVVRLIYRLENVYIRNTAIKFKVRSLIQRFNSYKAYWTRVERQIEEGTYVRDIRRAERNREKRRSSSQRRGAAEGGGQDDDGVIEIDFEEVVDLKELEVELEALDAQGAFDQRSKEPQMPAVDREALKRKKLAEIAGALGLSEAESSQPSPAAAAPTPRPQPTSTGVPSSGPASRGPATSIGAQREKLADIKKRLQQRAGGGGGGGGGGGDDDARRVFDQLLEAKRRCNEPTDRISYDSVAKSMQKQRDQLKKARGGDVEFKVVIKDGKAFIKPETK